MMNKKNILFRIFRKFFPQTAAAYLKYKDKGKLPVFPHNKGFCTVCEQHVTFYEFAPWLRDNYKCSNCNSIPRNRALVNALNIFYPNWKNSTLHESSPGGPLSFYLSKNAKGYSSSHFFEDIPRGAHSGDFRSEDLSALTFEDESLDIFITSDVFEHVMEPEKAFKEIARVLKKGGAHIFTMPWYPKYEKSIQRAKIENNEIIFLLEPIYHGNPISEKGSLVTYDWGRDFVNYIYKSSGLYTTIYLVKDRSLGLEAEFLEVFISVKE
ncbi:MAG: class I SAM-dependent methyltransferase [Bacteroidota bacterium]|nr:class I SAM-dependent methyltransferase [Bacteroidota bacterium]